MIEFLYMETKLLFFNVGLKALNLEIKKNFHKLCTNSQKPLTS